MICNLQVNLLVLDIFKHRFFSYQYPVGFLSRANASITRYVRRSVGRSNGWLHVAFSAFTGVFPITARAQVLG